MCFVVAVHVESMPSSKLMNVKKKMEIATAESKCNFQNLSRHKDGSKMTTIMPW